MKFTALLMAFLISLLCTSCNRETTEASQHEEPQTQEEIERERALKQRQGFWQWKNELLEELGPDGYITWHAQYTPQEVDDNVHLLEKWVSSFEQGQATAPLHIEAIGVDGPWIIRIDYDGRGGSIITENADYGEYRNHSSVVLKRTFDYVFLLDDFYWLDGRRDHYKIPHTAMLIEEVDYDLETMPSLGSIGPGEACEIFRVHYPDSSDPPIVFGAVKINGEFYYIVGSYYIKADGTLIMLAFHGLRVEFDANAREIRPPAQG